MHIQVYGITGWRCRTTYALTSYKRPQKTDPGDQSVLYAMHNKRNGAKGVLVNGFGIYSDPVVNKKIRKVH